MSDNDPMIFNIEFSMAENGQYVTIHYAEPREQTERSSQGRTFTFEAEIAPHIEEQIEEIKDQIGRLVDDALQEVKKPPKTIPSRKGRTSFDS